MADVKHQPTAWFSSQDTRESIEVALRVLEHSESTVRRAQSQIRRADAALKRIRRHSLRYAAVTGADALPGRESVGPERSPGTRDGRARDPEPPPTSPTSVVLIDLDDDAADMYQVGLRLAGLQPYVASDYQQVLDLMSHERPSAVVADVARGGAAVWEELVRALRVDESIRTIPVFLLTGRMDPWIRTKAAALGCAALLLKPCLPDQLAAVVRQSQHSFEIARIP